MEQLKQNQRTFGSVDGDFIKSDGTKNTRKMLRYLLGLILAGKMKYYGPYETTTTTATGTSKNNRVFSRDVMAAILVSQNNETAAMLVSQTSPVGVELFSYANTFFCSNKFA